MINIDEDAVRALVERRKEALARLAEAQREVWAVRDEVVAVVRELHATGLTDEAIGKMLGIARQSAQKYRTQGRLRSGPSQTQRERARKT